VSWQVGAFAVLALALGAGFAWYERTRPDARIIAMVGTLAAFAALGRIAFAALPNVKPTTDIVLISGFALGAAPGFVVGALAGLTSNFFFGQGPWTPWQMAAWGVAGLIGAALAVVSRRARHEPMLVSRWPLALLCAVVGFGFAAFQDVGDWVTYSDHSTAQLGVYVGKGVGFDLVHAAGCLAFALAFGPALARSVRRFGARLQVTWKPAGVLPALVGVVLAAQALGLAAAAPARAASPRAYLRAAQNSDGGFGPAPGAPSAQIYAGWSALGLAAVGESPADVRRGGASVLDYVAAGVASIADVGALERTILVVRAAGGSAQSFAGRDLAGELQHHIRPDGSVAQQVNLTAFAVLALRAAGVGVSPRTIAWLSRQQNGDGGFSFAGAGGGSDVDDTGAALQALGGANHFAARAVRFLRAQQNSDGGFPSQSGGESNAQSTAWAVQGLIAAGVDPGGLRRGSRSPLSFLRSMIAPDGHVRYSPSTDQTPVWVTAEASLALAGRALPLAPPAPQGSGSTAVSAQGTPAAARRAARVSAGRPRRARAARAPKRSVAASPSGATALLGPASEAGAVTALLLAPVGLG
jgi:energy-coupling factor transport system substrate-specific component